MAIPLLFTEFSDFTVPYRGVEQSMVSNVLLFCSGADSIRYGGTFPQFYKWLGTGHCQYRTANKKVTKLYSTSRKRSPKRLLVTYFNFVQPKTWKGTKIFSSTSRLMCASPLKFVLAPLLFCVLSGTLFHRHAR